MTPGVAAAYLGMIISRPATADVAGGRSRRAHLGRLARAIASAARADAGGAWKSDPSLIENDYFRLVNQPRG